jgi:Bacterial protein of unknown function (DUF924)
MLPSGSAAGFAADPLARAAAGCAIDRGFDRQADETERPSLHAFGSACGPGALLRPMPRCGGQAHPHKYVLLHADVIHRFGRFPHRNAVLGRGTTPEERAFLGRSGITDRGWNCSRDGGNTVFAASADDPGRVPGSASPANSAPNRTPSPGATGNDTTDRWLDSLMIETLYVKIESEEARAKLPPDADQSA